MSYESSTTPITSFIDVDGDNYPNLRGKGVGGKWKISDKALEKYLKREESRRGQYIGRATTALVIVTKLRSALAFPSIFFPFSSFFLHPSACRRHYSARRDVRSGLIELTIRQWHAEKRGAPWTCGVQSGRLASSLMHMERFIILNPFNV